MIALLWGLWSGLGVLIGLFAGFFFAGIGGLVTVLPDSNTGEPAPAWLGLLFGGFGLGVGGLIALISLAGIVVAICLGRGHRWAVVGIALVAFMQATNFPVGTVMAVATFWTIYKDPSGIFGRRTPGT